MCVPLPLKVPKVERVATNTGQFGGQTDNSLTLGERQKHREASSLGDFLKSFPVVLHWTSRLYSLL